MIQKVTRLNPTWVNLLLVTFLILEFHVLEHFPINGVWLFLDTVFLMALSVIGMCFFFLPRLFESELSIRVVMLLVLLVPIVSACQAYFNFGQPMLYGVLADRAKLYILSPVLMVFFVRRGWLKKEKLEQTLFHLAIIYLGVCIILYLFVDPSVFNHKSFATITEFKGVKYKLNSAFVILLVFLSYYKIAFEKRYEFAVLLAITVCYLFFLVKGRSLLFAVFLSSLYFFFIQLDNKKRRVFLITITPTVLVVALIINFFLLEEWHSNMKLFFSAIEVFRGNEAFDSSAASRVRQTDLVWGAVKERPYLGNGYLSTRWKEGYAGMFGHFFPSDLGWLGLIYLNGIVGLIILNLPFVLFFKYSVLITRDKRDALYHVMLNFMIYLFIHCAFAPFSIRKVGFLAFPLAIMYLYRVEEPSFEK